jgi:Uma2 family endonuclease
MRYAWEVTKSAILVSESEYLEKLTGELPAWEYLNGEVSQKPMPKRGHNDAVLNFGDAVADWLPSVGGYWTTEPTTDMSAASERRYLVPDLAAWLGDRVVDIDDVYQPPTVAVEVRSRGQSISALREKCRQYRASGVAVCWLVDPEHRAVEVFDPGRDGEPIDRELSSPAMPGFRLPVDALWARRMVASRGR